MESKPASAISIIETDLEVDFAAPKGYVEPDYTKPIQHPTSNIDQYILKEEKPKTFEGSGNRLSGRKNGGYHSSRYI